METPEHVEDVSLEGRENTQTGHWQPALRPDTVDTFHQQPYIFDAPGTEVEDASEPHARIDIIPPTPVSRHGERIEFPQKRIPAVPEEPEELDEPVVTSQPAPSQSARATTNGSSQTAATGFANDELPSDDDDERLDPAWGIKRFDSTHILDTVHHSATFPDLSLSEPPPLHTAVDEEPEDEEEQETLKGRAELEWVAEQDKNAVEPERLDWIRDDDAHDREPQAWTVPASEEPADEEEERYEEGVPLIQTEESSEAAIEPSRPDPFDTAGGDEETNFFSNINGSASVPPEIPTLGRKSTAQVLGSLLLAKQSLPDSPAVDSSAEASFFDGLATTTPSVANKNVPAAAENQDADDMWAAALGDDEFLVEDADDLLPDSDEEPLPVPNASQSQHRSQNSVNAYAPHQPTTSDMFQLPQATRTTHNNVGLSQTRLPPMSTFQTQAAQRPAAQAVKSFVDQAKDGYKSPYDLPLDLKPKRRSNVPQPVQTTRPTAPPPRSSSLSLKSPVSAAGPQMPGSAGVMQPPAPSPSVPVRSVSAVASSKTGTPRTGSSSGFFEELPITSKPRPAGRFTPQQSISAAFSPPLLQSPPTAPFPTHQQSAQQPQYQQPTASPPTDPYAQYQLQAPERLDPYGNTPLQPSAAMPAVMNARYSPAPPASVTSTLGARPGPSPRYSPAPPPQSAPANTARYAAQSTLPQAPIPAAAQPPSMMPTRPPSQPPPAAAILAFQPRTSSPLVYHGDSTDASANDLPPAPLKAPEPSAPRNLYTPSAASAAYSTASPERGGYGNLVNQVPPPKRPDGQQLPPPRRSQTQSPSKQRPQVAFTTYNSDIIGRPATAYGQASPSMAPAQLNNVLPARPAVRARGLSQNLDFVRPQDDTQFDPLERWKGAPVFRFGFGGSVASTFPRHVPRYGAGSARPQIKAAPGEIAVRDGKDLLPHVDLVNSFPGPLRSKSKKKDLLSWMSNYITGMEAGMPNIFTAQPHNDPARRLHEKVLLWKVMRVMVEHDGSLEGAALKAINLLLTPEVHNVDESSPIQYRAGEQSSGIYRPSGASVRLDSVDPMAVEALQKRLLSGDREGAVFHAMDTRLWSHALVIASTMERSVWGQVVREFVRQEVKTAAENTESLSALYEIFGGNVDESIDELVPPSARAGLQMISRVDTGGPAKNALDGLNRWKETLSLVLNNRCQGDHQALAVLAKLLQDYGRVEAAHICYLFSRSPQKSPLFGGLDEEQTSVVLLGANHKSQPSDFARDTDAILLTEIYEFAACILAPGSPTTFMPHLAVFKLQRATEMSETGLRAEAQSYCDAIAATFGKSSKMSPYYHPLLFSGLDDLTNKLKQTPIQGSQSWMGKPSLEKVGGSMWTRFNSFVVGDDSDADSKGSGKDAAESGPFARIAGTPSVSRTASQSDLYGAYPQAAPTVAGSKYAPSGNQSARSSAELTRGRPSLDSQRSPPSSSYSLQNRQHEPTNMFQAGPVGAPSNPYQSFGSASPPNSYPQSPPRSSYMPNSNTQPVTANVPPMRPGYAPTPPSEDVIQQAYGYASAPIGQIPEEQTVSFGGDQAPELNRASTPPLHDHYADNSFEASGQSYGFEPPTGDYVPYVPEPDSPEEPVKELRPKKKSFMDDDDDFPRVKSRTPISQGQSSVDSDEASRKKANDTAADAAFRAAAEADSARGKDQNQSKRSSSWLGGWFAGKKDEGLDAPSSKGGDQKVFRAKLGESKMKLYYDKDLGKWVNPDNPDAAQKSATPPPPPRMGGTPAPPTGASRPPLGPPPSLSNPAMSGGGMGPPSGPPSRVGTPADGPGPSFPAGPSPQIGVMGSPSAASTPPLSATSIPGLAPPARPSTAMSNASSIDDLIGPATSRKTAKGGKKAGKGRYVDVMAK